MSVTSYLTLLEGQITYIRSLWFSDIDTFRTCARINVCYQSKQRALLKGGLPLVCHVHYNSSSACAVEILSQRSGK